MAVAQTLFLLVLVAASSVASTIRSAPVVSTSIGQLKGLAATKSDRFQVNQYLGVPYAQAPVDERRFQRPLELPQTPSLVRDATAMRPTCVQMKHLSAAINPLLNLDIDHKTSEDCLFVNIYVPVRNESISNLPVFVFLPGEGFDFADARQFDGSYLASIGQAIVVTVQYRVGVFGFLKLEATAPGNMGLWDQLQALKWVKENIGAFGGDSNKVTLFGRFTGSMSISVLLTSPVLRSSQDLSLPLFNRAILSSGVAVASWVFEKQPYKKAVDYLTSLGCTAINATQCLASKSADELLEKASLGWRPTVDMVLIEEEPLKALSAGHFATGVSQVMVGSTEAEGSLCLLTHMATQSKYYQKILNDQVSEQDLMEMVEADTNMFMGGSSSRKNILLTSSLLLKSRKTSLRDKYMDFCSSLLIHSHADAFAQLVSNKSLAQVYTYRFQHHSPSSIAPSFLSTAAHGDDIIMAFGLVHKQVKPSAQDVLVTGKFIKYLSNFASSGNPNGSGHNNLWSSNSTMYIKTPRNLVHRHSKGNITHVENSSCVFTKNAETVLTFFSTHDYSSWQLVNSLSL